MLKAVIKTAIIALCLSSTLTAATSFKSSTACAKYCENCYYDSFKHQYICSQCLRRKFVNDQRCGYFQEPSSDHCVIYIGGYSGASCGICEPGYLFQALIGSSKGWACLRAITPNCVAGTIAVSSNNAHTRASETCTECRGSYPSSDQKSCNGGSLRESRCANGVRNLKNRPSGCGRCISGYALDVFSGQCKPAPTGCKTIGRSPSGAPICQDCDALNGYYFQKPGVCVRG